MPLSSSLSAMMTLSDSRPRPMAVPSPVTCFSYLASVQTLYVDTYPDLNYGTEITGTDRFLAGDGPIVAGALQALGHRAILGTNQLADDEAGRDVLGRLARWGLAPAPGTPPTTRTPVNIVACDKAGNRTWFSGLHGIADELKTADIALLASSPAVYIDCYEVLGDTPRILLAAALAAGADVTLNLGGSPMPEWLAACASRRRVRVIQTNAVGVDQQEAFLLLDALTAPDIADTAIVTRGRYGAIARTRTGDTVTADALDVNVRQVQGAGAVFSAALIHATEKTGSLEERLQYACAAGSLWCACKPDQDPPAPADIERALGSPTSSAALSSKDDLARPR